MFAVSLGARDQLLTARLRAAFGPSHALLALAMASAAATAAFAAFAGDWLADNMSENAASMFLAFALLFGAFELARPAQTKLPEEPTRSFGAIGLVLASRQISDAARFGVLALTVLFGAPWPAGIGGALGGAAAMALGWWLGAALERWPWLVLARRVLAATLLCCAVIAGLRARGLIG